jgi:acyl carrier protein phosphodiesterase
MDQLTAILYSKPGSNEVFNFTVLNIYNGHQVKFEDSQYDYYLNAFKNNLEEFHQHPSVIKSLSKIKNTRFGKQFLPVVYDHFTYKYWNTITDSDKNQTIEQTHQILLDNLDRAPKRAQLTILEMVKKNVYHKYGNLDGLPLINHSVHRFNPIYFQNAMNDFIRQYTAFQKDFEEYLPHLIEKIQQEEGVLA